MLDENWGDLHEDAYAEAELVLNFKPQALRGQVEDTRLLRVQARAVVAELKRSADKAAA